MSLWCARGLDEGCKWRLHKMVLIHAFDFLSKANYDTEDHQDVVLLHDSQSRVSPFIWPNRDNVPNIDLRRLDVDRSTDKHACATTLKEVERSRSNSATRYKLSTCLYKTFCKSE